MEQSLFKLESIGNGVHIYTDALHGVGTDAVVLAVPAAALFLFYGRVMSTRSIPRRWSCSPQQ